jgi:hypothetical protein
MEKARGVGASSEEDRFDKKKNIMIAVKKTLCLHQVRRLFFTDRYAEGSRKLQNPFFWSLTGNVQRVHVLRLQSFKERSVLLEMDEKERALAQNAGPTGWYRIRVEFPQLANTLIGLMYRVRTDHRFSCGFRGGDSPTVTTTF